jgi:hypothetical protein
MDTAEGSFLRGRKILKESGLVSKESEEETLDLGFDSIANEDIPEDSDIMTRLREMLSFNTVLPDNASVGEALDLLEENYAKIEAFLSHYEILLNEAKEDLKIERQYNRELKEKFTAQENLQKEFYVRLAKFEKEYEEYQQERIEKGKEIQKRIDNLEKDSEDLNECFDTILNRYSFLGGEL